jgi:hypothetical protein
MAIFITEVMVHVATKIGLSQAHILVRASPNNSFQDSNVTPDFKLPGLDNVAKLATMKSI